MRIHLIFAVLLILEEALIGTGFGAASLLVGAALLIVYLVNRRKNRKTLILAAIYALAGIASFAIIAINSRIAEARSKPVIAACKQFHRSTGAIPTR
jgi:uncharacterized membrane protein HdeD (DUF308 family)